MKRNTIFILVGAAAVVLLAVYLLENFNPDAPATNPPAPEAGETTGAATTTDEPTAPTTDTTGPPAP